MKTKKLFAMILGITMTASLLGGCGSSEENAPAAPSEPSTEVSQDATSNSETSQEDAAGTGDTRTLTLAATLGNSTSIIQTTTTMSEKVKEETGGSIDIQVFPDSTLGGQRDFLEGVSMGTVDMCIIVAGALIIAGDYFYWL